MLECASGIWILANVFVHVGHTCIQSIVYSPSLLYYCSSEQPHPLTQHQQQHWLIPVSPTPTWEDHHHLWQHLSPPSTSWSDWTPCHIQGFLKVTMYSIQYILVILLVYVNGSTDYPDCLVYLSAHHILTRSLPTLLSTHYSWELL